MKRFLALSISVLAATGCKPESARKADRAAEELKKAREAARDAAVQPAATQASETPPGKLEKAEAEFQANKRVRLQSLRGQHSVIATQTTLIGAMARSLALTDKGRADVNEKLKAFQRRLDETANLIEGLAHTEVDAWIEHDETVTEAMERLDDARAAAWHSLDEAPKAESNAS